jgi:AbrB family looped-hinge helix DNA binding protein
MFDSTQVRRYLTYMKTTVSSKGQIVIPAELRQQDHIVPGQQFEVERIQDGEYLLKKVKSQATLSIADWILDCPEKDWFTPIESESTDTLIKDIEKLFEDS